MEDRIKRVIIKYKELLPKDILPRILKIHQTKLDKANVIVGPRRSGKSFFLYSIAKKEKNPVIINFEDNLLDLNTEELIKIPEYAKEIYGTKDLSFFFDEIQEVGNWERFVVSLVNAHYPVYITGSNSRLLSKDIATSLRGKSLPYLMLPFSFKEFLNALNITPERNYQYTDKVHEIKKRFNEFMKFGGFPEIILSRELHLKNKLANNYFDSVIYKDLIERLNLRNIKLVEITIKYLLNLFGNAFSISAFERYLKSNNIPHSLEDIYTILKALEDIFMLSYVKEYSKSFKKKEISKSKVYLFDTAYIHYISNEPEDFGRILENLVFIELFRREEDIENKSIFYYRSKSSECDFVLVNRDKVHTAIQVTYNLNDKNRDREIKGLVDAMDFFNLRKGILLTYDQEEEIKINGKKIVVIPVWKWMLE